MVFDWVFMAHITLKSMPLRFHEMCIITISIAIIILILILIVGVFCEENRRYLTQNSILVYRLQTTKHSDFAKNDFPNKEKMLRPSAILDSFSVQCSVFIFCCRNGVNSGKIHFKYS